MRFNVLFGFGVVVLLMALVGAISLQQIRAANDSITTIVEVNNAKIDFANTMRDAIRLRQISMKSMLAMEDHFELDQELMHFYQHARPYRIARQKLLALPTDKREKHIHEQLTRQVRIAQPLNKEAAVLLAENRPLHETRAAVTLANREQVKLLALLDDLVALQRDYAHKAVITGQREFEDTLFWVITLGGIVMFGTLAIGVFVARVVALKNEELVSKNSELADAYQQTEAATNSKSAFLATMSHEIRTPLTAIIGFAETSLYSDQSMEQRHRAINTIIRSGKHLLQIINDILDLSKIEANKLEVERVSLSPFLLLAEIEPFIRPKAAEKGLVCGVNFLFPLPEQIKSDPLRLKQILLNLCSNALKFTSTGHIYINVSADTRAEQMIFELIDSGIGMDVDQLEKIFEPFKQADSTTSRKYGGTGLGLSLSKQLAQALGGSLSVESEPGQGSRFRLTVATDSLADVELVHDQQHVPNQPPANVQPLPSNAFVGTILLAEDNPDNQQLLSTLLRRLGAEVTLAENGLIAVEKAQHNQFDLILMDMQMPEMDGIDAVRLLREKGYDKPIVALTANAMNEDRKKCLAAGCNDFLTKPLDTERFYEVVATYLSPGPLAQPESAPIQSALLEADVDFSELVHNYIEGLPCVLQRIEDALREDDWDQLKSPVHQLKGSGGNFGFAELSDIAASMEFQALSKNSGELSRLFQELRSIYNRIAAGATTTTLGAVAANKPAGA